MSDRIPVPRDPENDYTAEMAQRRQELLPEFEQRLKHLECCLGKLPQGQPALVEGYYYERANIGTLAEQIRFVNDAWL